MEPTSRSLIDEDDVALIDALHVNPRASFEQLGGVLGISAVTVGRRWRRLISAGLAWVSSAPGPAMPMAGALVDVECAPGRDVEVAHALAAVPQVASVHLTTGSHDLYALVLAADNAAMSGLLLDRLGRLPGVVRVRASVATEIFSGVHWRLGAISAHAARALAIVTAGGDAPVVRELSRFDRDMFRALQVDGRATLRDLACALDRSEQAVKRRLDHLVRSGVLALRTDFARGEGGWQVQVALAMRVPDELLTDIGRQIGGWPETRVCAAVVARDNLFVTVQLHDLQALEPLLRRIRTTWPDAAVADRRVVLRSVKSWGRLLDHTGRAVDVVPVDPWV